MSKTEKNKSKKRKPKHEPPECIECGKTADLVDGKTIYTHRPDLYHLNFWLCECGAYVGCHKTGDFKKPLGTPCSAETRNARGYVHKLLDPMWMNAHELHFYKPESDLAKQKIKRRARTRIYKFMQKEMGFKKDFHIGELDIHQCRKAYAILKKTSYEKIRNLDEETKEKGA